MEIKQWINKIGDVFKKYRYAVIVLLIGLILMAIPEIKSGTSAESNTSVDPGKSSVQSLEQKLSELLSKVDGAGEVEVILTVAAGEEIIYQTNDDCADTDTTFSNNRNTVTVTDSDRNQIGLVRQVKSETYQGAIVVCSGANNPAVRLAIVDAVSRVTGLGANCISVLKMK